MPLYLRHGASAGSPKPVVLTVHNLAYQGVYPASALERVGLPGSLFHVDGLEFYGQVNFLKGGLQAAEAITTVSPSYAREILTSSHGAGLEGVLRERSRDLVGILNGIDHSVWDPAHDPALAVSFDSRRSAGKTENKLQLQKELGLTISAETPLLAAIGRLDAQKGFNLLLEAAPRLFRAGAQLVVLGSGTTELLRAFEELRARHPGSLAAERGFRDDLGRRIYASSDLFLMPSCYEPCGLGQLVAMRYGSLPVVRSTGRARRYRARSGRGSGWRQRVRVRGAQRSGARSGSRTRGFALPLGQRSVAEMGGTGHGGGFFVGEIRGALHRSLSACLARAEVRNIR